MNSMNYDFSTIKQAPSLGYSPSNSTFLTPSPWGYNPFMVPGAGSNEFNASQAYPNRPSFYTRYTRQGVDQYDPNTLKYYKR
jgi:hypothetical protein